MTEKRELRVLPINTTVDRKLFLEVCDCLQSQYRNQYSNVELLENIVVTHETNLELFYKDTNGQSYLEVDTNPGRRKPTDIFRYLTQYKESVDEHVIAITEPQLYNWFSNNSFYQGINGMVEKELGTGILTYMKFLPELGLTTYNKLRDLFFFTRIPVRKRLKRLFKKSEDLFLDKLKFLAVHEVGHLHGLGHCFNNLPNESLCAMNDSHYIAIRTGKMNWTMPDDYDIAGYELCGDCKIQLNGNYSFQI